MIRPITAVLAALFCLDAVRAEFNFTTCPAFYEVQNEKVAKNFDVTKLVGTYYEQALHDYTQYPTCPSISCIRSHKEFTDVGDGKSQIHDTFSLHCFGHEYVAPYFFNTTADAGSLVGFLVDPPVWWKVLFAEVYPDTIVDYKESADGGQYEWVIEFQCREKDPLIGGEKVGFTGFNFYSRDQHVSDETYDEMIQAARDAGLGVYMDHGWGLLKVDQTDCNYDAVDETETILRPLTNWDNWAFKGALLQHNGFVQKAINLRKFPNKTIKLNQIV